MSKLCWKRETGGAKGIFFKILTILSIFSTFHTGTHVFAQASGKAKPLVTYREFKQGLKTASPVARTENQALDHYTHFVDQLSKGNIQTKLEAAMALSQFIHESGGLRYTREIGCSDPKKCQYKQKSCDVPGQRYFGRGFIQLTWCENYRAASKDLGLNETLRMDPDRVARESKLSWATSFWYWKKNVHSRRGIREGHFGVSTLAINPGECRSSKAAVRQRAKNRFGVYQKVFKAFNLPGRPIETGCYPVR